MVGFRVGGSGFRVQCFCWPGSALHFFQFRVLGSRIGKFKALNPKP